MGQPPHADAKPTGEAGHPEPPPTPDPAPPAPVPPPDPLPTPEPPHATAAADPSPPDPRRRRRTGLWISLALVVVLLFCGGGAVSAYLLLRNAENGKGAVDPTTAVSRFMTAIYTEKDAAIASKLVCSEARDAKKIAAKVDEIKGYAQQYDKPTFTWAQPTVEQQTDERALVSVTLTVTTADERMATQELAFTVVRKTGWWVCEAAG